MTSATLQTNRSFDYIRERLNAQQVETVEVGSPFNYHDSTLLYIPNDMPDPNDRYRYQQAVERGLIELTAALNGRVMGLFTSYTHLRQTAQAITPRLALGNITVYDQSDGSSRQSLLDGFKTTERAILLGTRSFWEGVDIPGEIAQRAGDRPPALLGADRSGFRRPRRNLHRFVQQLHAARCDPALPAGLWSPDPHPHRPGHRRHLRLARADQELRRELSRRAAGLHRHSAARLSSSARNRRWIGLNEARIGSKVC